jgi:glyoxylase-like metal-dependent hydrolase (beta-lactamase superfamily II)
MFLRCHAPGVYGWSRFQAERGYDFNGTALVCEGDDTGTVLVVDPVAPTEDELNAIRRLGSRFIVVLLNADHERVGVWLAKELAAPLRISEPDLQFIAAPEAVGYRDGHVFPGGWVAHIMRDLKTPGEAILYHADKGILVIGDAVIGDPVTGLRLVPPSRLGDRDAALASLSTLLAYDFDSLILGDGFVLPSGGKAALQQFLDIARQV